jgi:hypothetical protein
MKTAILAIAFLFLTSFYVKADSPPRNYTKMAQMRCTTICGQGYSRDQCVTSCR